MVMKLKGKKDKKQVLFLVLVKMSDILIRKIQKQEIKELINLCALHAKYENASYDKTGKEEKLHLALFKEDSNITCFVAIQNEEILAYATAILEFSTWDADYYLHMDCLYIKESHRGKGLGENFMSKIKEHAKELGCNHIEWQTPSNNYKAIKFYEKMGAKNKDKKRFSLYL